MIHGKFQPLVVLGLALSFPGSDTSAANVNQDRIRQQISDEFPALFELYQHLHAHPELSFMEEVTANRIGDELAKAGFEVTRKVGGHGIVALLKNGPGPTVMVRCDLDGLPVEERTGLAYASKARMTDSAGIDVPTMHACGHDVHMTSLIGSARILAANRDAWQGTLMLIAQPAEERGGGAKAMLADRLFERFPVPDQAIALHVHSSMAAGTIGYTPGFALANVDSVDIKIFGIGGHGAYPQATKDPIVLAAQTILALQTVVSREISPIDPGVITVGSIHGGTKHNVIPNEVHLQLTVRSYSDSVRDQLLSAIKRITRGQAIAAGIPEDKLPIVSVKDEYTPAVYNNPTLTLRLKDVFDDWLGKGTATERKPQMGGEDFGRYGRTEQKIPICIFWLGAASRDSVTRAIKAGGTLPSLHSPLFAPDPEPTITTGVTATVGAVLNLMPRN
jgi:amidohydrolase